MLKRKNKDRKHKIVRVGFHQYKITGIPMLSFDSYWKAKAYLYQI